MGVDVFFVISGFLISRIILSGAESGRFSFWSFYARRIRRIFPALLVVLLVTLALGYLLLLPDEYEHLGLHVLAGALFSANLLSWTESGYFAAAAEHKPLLHLWSLGIEEQFYLLWPATLLAVLTLRRRRTHCIAVIIVASCLLNVWLVTRNPTAAFYSPLTRVWELLLGALLAVSPSMRRAEGAVGQGARNLLGVAGLALIVSSIARVGPHTSFPFPGWSALGPTIGTALVMAAGPTAWLNRYVLSTRLAVGLGLISYALYLWHWPLLVIARLSFSESPAIRVWIIALAVVLSWLSYRYVEVPCRAARRGTGTALLLLGGLAVVAALGAAVYGMGGIARRFPKDVQAVMQFRFDHVKAYREECSLPPTRDPRDFPYCVDLPETGGTRSLFLWGDSHAGHLYPGIVKRFGRDHRITRLTASSCPPILGHPVPPSFPVCEAFNRHVISLVAKERPDRIIIAAGWKWYDWPRLAPTIARLRSEGIGRIDVVGPVPNWLPTLRRSLVNYARLHPGHEFPAKRMTLGLDPRIHPLDQSMRELVGKLGVDYFSPWDVLCTNEGCLTTLTSPTAWDYGHLTSQASEYLISRLPD